MQSTVPLLLNSLLMTAPMLLVYCGGMALAVSRWRRAPRAAAFATAGLGIMLFTTLASTASQLYLVSNRPPSSIGATLAIINLALSLIRAAGLALVVVAVFAERETLHGFDINPTPMPPPLPHSAQFPG